MAAGKRVKEEGLDNDLLTRIASDPAFGLDEEALKAAMDPKKYVGRAPYQTEKYLREVVRPVLEANAGAAEETSDINV